MSEAGRRRVPGAETATADPRKIIDYLLCPTHARGASKARFFLAFGFERGAPDALLAALLDHVASNDVNGERPTERGVAYEVVGAIVSPDRRNPVVCSVWEVVGDGSPRLITAYPSR